MKSVSSKLQIFDLFKLYMLCDESGNLKVFNFNENKFIFVVKVSEFDTNGWANIDGFSFKEKLYILGFHTNTVWRKIKVEDILHLICRYKFLFPYQLIINVRNQKVSKHISRRNLTESILLYSEVLGQ